MIIIEILTGILLASLVLLTFRKREKSELQIWSMALIIAVLVYVGFALNAANWEWLGISSIN